MVEDKRKYNSAPKKGKAKKRPVTIYYPGNKIDDLGGDAKVRRLMKVLLDYEHEALERLKFTQ